MGIVLATNSLSGLVEFVIKINESTPTKCLQLAKRAHPTELAYDLEAGQEMRQRREYANAARTRSRCSLQAESEHNGRHIIL